MMAKLRKRLFGRLVLIPVLAWLAPACQLVDAGDPDHADVLERRPGGCKGDRRCVPVAPLAPTVDNPMYQGTQRDFRTKSGDTCRGRVAASMGTTGFCYLAAEDDVKCSGMIGGVDYGFTPTDTGQTGAEQIMLFFGIGDGMCITKTDRTVQCMGTNTNAFGDTLSTTFGPWTARNDFAAIASGTWDQICGITTSGQVYCGGRGDPDFGNPPIAVGEPGQRSLWVDGFGIAQLSDISVLRPAESRTECQVRAHGLDCWGTSFGPTNGTVVSGGQMWTGISPVTCWLDSTGTVGCSIGPRFAPGKVLFLAANFYSDSMCAIYNDGSIWCIGSNDNGKLGTGNEAPLLTETMVAPPGSARTRCD
jgi:hypothetical protein